MRRAGRARRKGKGTPTKINRATFLKEGTGSSADSDIAGTTPSPSSSCTTTTGPSSVTEGSMDDCMRSPSARSHTHVHPLYREEDEYSESESSVHLHLPDSEDLLAGTDERQGSGSDGTSSPPSTQDQSTTSDSSSQLSQQGTSHTTTSTAAAGSTRWGSTFHKPRGSLCEHFENSCEDSRLAVCKKCGLVMRRGNDPKHLSSSALHSHLM